MLLKENKVDSGKASVMRNTMIVLIFSFLTKILSLVRESTLAAFAGTDMIADAYYLIQGFFVIIEAGLYTSIYQSFFPIYRQISVKESSKKELNDFTNSAVSVLVMISIVIAVIVLVGRHFFVKLMAPGFAPETQAVASYLTVFVGPMLVLTVMAECVSAILRAHNRFISSQIRDVATHVAAIAIIVLLYKQNSLLALGFGMLVGAVARLVVQLPAIYSEQRLRFSLHFRNKDLREMLRRIPAILISTSSTQLKNMVDKMMASMLPSGTVASLNYGHKLESALGGLLSTAMATGMYPEMVALYVKGEKEKLSRMLYRSILVFALIVVPVCIGGSFVGDAVVSIVYERGAFGADAVQTTAGVFVAYLLGTFFHGASNIVSNVFYSAGNTRTPMIINCIDLVLNVALNLILMRVMGVVGLALATSVTTIAGCAMRFAMLRKYLVMPERSFWLELLRFVTGGLLAGVLSVTAIRWIGIESRLLFLICVVAVFAVIYLAFLIVTKSSSVRDALNMLKRKLRRGVKK